MSETFDSLEKVIVETKADLEKAEKGNKSAAVRVRKAMQDIKRIAQDVRKEMMEVKSSS